jgi:hypothetical protein
MIAFPAFEATLPYRRFGGDMLARNRGCGQLDRTRDDSLNATATRFIPTLVHASILSDSVSRAIDHPGHPK